MPHILDPDAPGFNPGAVPSRPDPRDYSYTAEIGANSPPFDWELGFDIEEALETNLDPKDQGTSSSCGGQAWAMLASVLEANHSKTLEERSAKYIYAQTFSPFGGGSMGRDNCEVVNKQGVSRETLTPSYENSKPPKEAFMTRPQDISDEARQDAKLSKTHSYANVALDADSIAKAIRDNGGVVIGVCGSNNGTWKSKFPKKPKAGETIWRHWVYAGKAVKIGGKHYIGVLNSWGWDVGENGWQYLSEDYIESDVFDSTLNIIQQCVWEARTHVFNPEPPAPGFSHHFALELRYGDNSAEVTALQKALQIDGVFPATVPTTGLYGDITRRAVLKFQIKYQVAPLSELNSLAGKLVGVKTRAQLNKLFNV